MQRLILLLLLSLAACGSETETPATDSGVRDAGFRDAATDSGFADAAADAAVDAGVADTGTADSGADAGVDAGMPSGTFPSRSCQRGKRPCYEFSPGEEDDFLDLINKLDDDVTIILATGTFRFDNAVTIRRADGIELLGQGIDQTILDFSPQTAQANGVDVIGDDFTIGYLTLTDSQKDALRIEDSTNVIIRAVKATWSGGPLTTNGSYGLYPVRCTNVLMEDSEAYNASDAGLYIGQSINVIVRRNIARFNVAGLEIENTQFADVYENIVENNSGGLLIFDLPGNPVIGRDVLIRDNQVRNNNQPNFAPSGTTVSQIPAGTGTFALASRRLEIRSNVYENNLTTDVALLSGLAVASSTAAWAIAADQVVGSTVGLELIQVGGRYYNFRSDAIWVHDNQHLGATGTRPDGTNQEARPLGTLLALVYYEGAATRVDQLLYDGIGEVVDPSTPANNTNRNHICISNVGNATYATLDLSRLAAILDEGQIPTRANLYRPAAPFAPFNCSAIFGGPIPPVILPIR